MQLIFISHNLFSVFLCKLVAIIVASKFFFLMFPLLPYQFGFNHNVIVNLQFLKWFPSVFWIEQWTMITNKSYNSKQNQAIFENQFSVHGLNCLVFKEELLYRQILRVVRGSIGIVCTSWTTVLARAGSTPSFASMLVGCQIPADWQVFFFFKFNFFF